MSKPQRFLDFFAAINALVAFLVLFQHVNDRFAYPFIYLKPLKGTLFGRSLPVYAIIGSSCTAPEMIPNPEMGIISG